MNESYDLVVVGAGGCGLTGALAAAERGARVLLLERDTRAGGTTALSAGIFVAAGSRMQQAHGVTAGPDELAADILRLNLGQSDPGVTRALCRISGPLMDWLADRGVPLEHMADYRYPGMSAPWLHAPPRRHGAVMIEALLNAVEAESRIELRLGCGAAGLLVEEGRVAGVTFAGASCGAGEARAGAVLLAASGFGANERLVAEHIPGLAGAYFGAPFADGEALRWARDLGAATAHMGAYQAHSSIARPEGLLVTTYLINHGAIQVNRHGRRFGDETDTYAGHALVVQAQPGSEAIEIFDRRILEQTLGNYPRFQECLDAGLVHRAENVTELARRFDLPAAALASTVAAYEQAIKDGEDEFGRTQFGVPLRAPFYGIRVTSALVQTLGGLRVDARARVLREDGKPVPGLYAGGGTAAGLAGDRTEGYLAGTGLLTAFGLGWLAAREVGRLS